MITLYGFGPAFGLPEASPFVMKTEVQLTMAGLPYAKRRGNPVEAPKGKLPYIEDGDEVIDDSTFIRDYIESRHGIDLDRSLMREQRALAWALERMMEDHLYWAILHLRWTDDANFAKGPAHFFDMLPEDIREATRRSRRARVQSLSRTTASGATAYPRSPLLPRAPCDRFPICSRTTLT